MSTNRDNPTAAAALTRLALVLAIALVIARATFEENARDRDIATPGTQAIPRSALATTGLIFDFVMILPALLVLWRRALDPDFQLRPTVSHAMFGAMAVLAALSAFWSPDKFIAAITASHFIAAAALIWSMTQLVHSWLELRLVAAACFGLLLVYVCKGAIYRFVDLPATMETFQDQEAEILRSRGLEPGSFQAEQFEKKLRSGELFGFSHSPNTYAAMLVTLGIVAAGAAIQRVVDHDEWGWVTAIVAVLAAAACLIFYTQSKAAFVSPVLAAAMLAGAPKLGNHRRKAYLVGAAVLIAGSILLVLHGMFHGTLLVDSLTFRWRYWIGAVRVFKLHPLLGVGWSNFGACYIGVRLPIAAEEIKDPHSFVIRAFVELGLVGGVLMLAWLARMWWEMIVRGGLPLKGQTRQMTFKTITMIGAGAILLNIAGSVDFTSDYPDRQWYVLLELLTRLLFLVLVLLGFVIILIRSSRHSVLDDRPAPWIVRAMVVAAGIFLIHNLIDFSFSEPGPMWLFAMLAGTALAGSGGGDPGNSNARKGGATRASLATLLWLAAGIGIVAPVATAEHRTQSGNEAVRRSQLDLAISDYRDAMNDLWIPNADYQFRAAVAMQQAGVPAVEVRRMIDAAVTADPMQVRSHRMQAQFELQLPQPDSNRVIGSFERAIALDPNEVQAHLDFADALVRLNRPQRAGDEYQTALRFNDLLDPNEPKRLSSSQIQAIRRKIDSIRG